VNFCGKLESVHYAGHVDVRHEGGYLGSGLKQSKSFVCRRGSYCCEPRVDDFCANEFKDQMLVFDDQQSHVSEFQSEGEF